MNINNSYIKKTSSTLVKEAQINADNLIVQGQSLTDQITGILGEITADNLLQANTPSLSGNNIFSGTNQMSSISIPNSISANSTSISLAKLPRLSTNITPTDGNDLVTKSFVDGSVLDIRPLNNIFTGSNTFNNVINCATLPSANSHLTNKQYVDLSVSTNITTLKSSSNNWTSSNTFNTNLPTSTLTPTSNIHLTTKAYVDSQDTAIINNLKSSSNTFTNQQTISASGLTPLILNSSVTGKGVTFVADGSQGNFNPMFSNNSSGVIATGSIDATSLILAPHSSIASGIAIYNNNMVLGCGGNAVNPTSNIKINDTTIEISRIPILSTDLTTSIIDNKHLTNKKYVDDKVATVTKTSLSLQNVDNTNDISKPISNQTKTYVDDKVATITKTSLELQNVDNTADINKVMSNPTKTYIDNAVLSSYNQAGQLIQYANNAYTDYQLTGDPSKPYRLNYPYMGGANTNTTVINAYVYKEVFIQTKIAPLDGLTYQGLEIDVIYWLNRNNRLVNQSAFLEGTAVRKASPFTPGEIAGSASGFPIIHKATIYLTNSASNIGVLPKISFATLNLFGNFSIQTGLTVDTNSNNLTATCIPVKFATETIPQGQTLTQRQKISISYPNFYNNPLCFGGGINNYGFSIQITKGFDPTGVNGWYLTEN